MIDKTSIKRKLNANAAEGMAWKVDKLMYNKILDITIAWY